MRVEMLSHGKGVAEQTNSHGGTIRVADWVAVELDAEAWEYVGRCILTVLRCSQELSVAPEHIMNVDRLGGAWADVQEMMVAHVAQRDGADAVAAAQRLIMGC